MKQDERVALRPAVLGDLPLLTVFMRKLREDDPEEGAFDEPRCVPALWRLIADPSLGRCWLILVDEKDAGYAVLTLGYSIEFGGVAAYVDELFVDRNHRGQGIGTQALKRIVRESRMLDVAILLLEVTQSNPRATHVYRKAGFADRGHHLMTLRPA